MGTTLLLSFLHLSLLCVLPAFLSAQVTSLTGHQGPVVQAHFNADGTRLASVGSDSTVRVWSTMSGQPVCVIRTPAQRAFLSPDGRRLLTHNKAVGILRWDAQTGAFLDTLLLGSRFTVMATGRDHMIIGLNRSTMYYFDLMSPQGYRMVKVDGFNYEGDLYAVAYPDTERSGIICRYVEYRTPDLPLDVGGFPAIQVIRISQSGKLSNPRDTMVGPTRFIHLTFRPGSTTELAALTDGPYQYLHVSLIPTTTGGVDRIGTGPYISGSLYASGLTYTPDGTRIATSEPDMVRFRDVETGEVVDSIPGARYLVYSADGRFTAICRSDGTIDLEGEISGSESRPFVFAPIDTIDVGNAVVGESARVTIPDFARNIDREAHSIRFHINTVVQSEFRVIGDEEVTLQPGETYSLTIEFNPRSRRVVGTSLTLLPVGEQPSAARRVIGTGLLSYFQPGDSAYYLAGGLQANSHIYFGGTSYLLEGDGKEVRVWSATYSNLIETRSGRFLPVDVDSRYVTLLDGRLDLFNIVTGETDYSWNIALPPEIGHHTASSISLWSGDSLYSLLAATTSFGEPQLIDVAADTVARLLPHPKENNSPSYTDLSFSPDGSMLLASNYYGRIALWDTETRDSLWTVKRPVSDFPRAIVSHDGTLIAARHEQNSLAIRSAETGAIIHHLTGHNGTATPIAFSPDDTHVLTISVDNTARIWNVETGGEVHNLSPHPGDLLTAAFSPDGERVVTRVRSNPDIFVWEAATGRLLRKFTWESSGFTEADAGRLSNRERTGLISFSPEGTRLAVSSSNGIAVFGPAVAVPYITLDRDEIDLTPLSIGGDTTITVRLTNVSESAVELTPKVFPPTDAFTLAEGNTRFSIGPGEDRTVELTFRPASIEKGNDPTSASNSVVTTYLGFMYGEGGSIANVRLEGNSTVTTDVQTSPEVRDRISLRVVDLTYGSNDVALAVSAPRAGVASLRLINIRGEEIAFIAEEHVSEGTQTIRITTSPYPPGEYFIVVSSADGQDVQPILIVR